MYCVCKLVRTIILEELSPSLLCPGGSDETLLAVTDVRSSVSKPAAAPRSKRTLSEEHVDAAKGLKKCTVRVTGMTCGSCVANIEKHLHTFRGENQTATDSHIRAVEIGS